MSIGSGWFSAKVVVSELPFLDSVNFLFRKNGPNLVVLVLVAPGSFFSWDVEETGRFHHVRLGADVFILETAHGRPYTCVEVTKFLALCA